MKTIVVGYDGSAAAKKALERAAEFAAGGAGVTVVSAVHVLAHAGRGASGVDPVEKEERTANLREAESLLAGKGVTHRTVEGHGDPADVIVEEAKEVSADLIIVGASGHSAPARALLGSVSTRVLHHAPCDVLVVR